MSKLHLKLYLMIGFFASMVSFSLFNIIFIIPLKALNDFNFSSKISFPEEHDEIALMKTLIDSGMKLLLLNGDSDIINPLTGTQQFSLDLGYEVYNSLFIILNKIKRFKKISCRF